MLRLRSLVSRCFQSIPANSWMNYFTSWCLQTPACTSVPSYSLLSSVPSFHGLPQTMRFPQVWKSWLKILRSLCPVRLAVNKSLNGLVVAQLQWCQCIKDSRIVSCLKILSCAPNMSRCWDSLQLHQLLLVFCIRKLWIWESLRVVNGLCACESSKELRYMIYPIRDHEPACRHHESASRLTTAYPVIHATR